MSEQEQSGLRDQPDRADRPLDQLKIIIASTPKTGNTWLRYLLAAIYDLPMVALNKTFDAAALNALGPRWIGHEHYQPSPDLIDWAEQNGVVLITTIRHPGDVLISLYHYVRNYVKDSRVSGFGPETAMADDGDTFGEQTSAFVRTTFHTLLDISANWVRSGSSYVVRYEDLWRDPVGRLSALTDQIHPIALDRIERSVEQCDISVMRNMSKNDGKFFRQGGSGGWRDALPVEVIELFRSVEPYPAQFAALGYTLDPEDALFRAPIQPRPSKIRHISHFDNGVAVPPVAVQLYLSFDSATASARWPNVSDTAAGSFYAWMNGPADADPQRSAGPLITNLADYMHRIRQDLVKAFPDIYGQERVRYVLWVIRSAQQEYKLDRAFITPMLESFLAWANTPAPEDPQKHTSALTSFALAMCRNNPTLQRAFLSVYDRHRQDYLAWFRRRTQRIRANVGNLKRAIRVAWTRGSTNR